MDPDDSHLQVRSPPIYTWHWKQTPPPKLSLDNLWQSFFPTLNLWICSGVKIWQKHEMAVS